ncbi:MAG TPA: Ig domain-containing protein [Clostridia bacterium]|nr:Ig domain-containing protein [Clostridia bacterium]
MFRFLKPCAWVAVLLVSFQSAHSFSLLGPVNEGYQVPTIGYDLPGDIGAPKNLGEEYRWNTPNVFYAFDASFLDYFRSNGIVAVENAIAILNDLTNHPFSTLNVDDFPLESRRVNNRAQALGLFDLKSATLVLMLEELGLAEPDRYVWTLRDRRTQPGLSCPFMIYDVIRRNFDPVTHQPSTYVNGVLFTYIISEICTGPNPLGVTVTFPVDQTSQDFTPVAAQGVGHGIFYTTLTRDDVGGLKYLMATNNVNWESPSSDSLLFSTNLSQPTLIISSNLAALFYQARTNNAAGLAALYPDLIITGTSNSFRFNWITNFTPYFTNFPWDPVPSIPHLAFATNITWGVETLFHHTFGNLMTFSNSPNGVVAVPLERVPGAGTMTRVTLETTMVTNSPWMPAGFAITNVTRRSYLTNRSVGEFFILPTNACDVKLITRLATVTNFYTNLVVSATNAVIIDTNGVAGTNGIGLFTQNLIESSVNRIFLAYQVECLATNNATLRQGMDSIRFIRTDYDSLIGRFYKPITNVYHLLEVTNGIIVTNWFERVATTPDWVFDAADLFETAASRTETSVNFRTNNQIAGLAGPGNIEPNMTITFNKVGPLNINVYAGTNAVFLQLSQETSITNFIWASFDGSTNEPLVYPPDVRLDDIEKLIYYQITTAELPAATLGTPYDFPLTVFGGKPPFYWAPAFESAPLPLDLSISPDGRLVGLPEETGTFNFTATVTDAEGRTVSRTLSITVNP